MDAVVRRDRARNKIWVGLSDSGEDQLAILEKLARVCPLGSSGLV